MDRPLHFPEPTVVKMVAPELEQALQEHLLLASATSAAQGLVELLTGYVELPVLEPRLVLVLVGQPASESEEKMVLE